MVIPFTVKNKTRKRLASTVFIRREGVVEDGEKKYTLN